MRYACSSKRGNELSRPIHSRSTIVRARSQTQYWADSVHRGVTSGAVARYDVQSRFVREAKAVKRSVPYLIATITMMVGGYLLALYAQDMSQMSVLAFGTGGQSMMGAPVIWVASTFPQIRVLSVALPAVIFAAWRMRWLSDTTCVLYLVTWAFAILTWTISVAYFSVQPGILG